MTPTPLLELLLGESPYSVDLIQGNGSKPFVSISGAKKGSRRKGGGIIIPDLKSLDCILGLIGVIGSLAIPTHPAEEQVAFCTERTRFLSGETKLFNDQWFYRIKVYRNFFKDVETGMYIPLKGHGLRPEGRGFFIQEMDFPINEAGREFVPKFIAQVYGAIKEAIQCSSTNDENDLLELTRQLRILVGGDLPWITSDRQAKAIHLIEQLFDTVCQCLMDDPYTEQSLAAKIHINPSLSASFTNPAVRYAPEFLAREIVVDRLRGIHGNLEYQATKIPHRVLINIGKFLPHVGL